MMYICPHCKEKIDYLNYSMNKTEYGSYYIETENFDYSDTSDSGDTNFQCPECENDITCPDELEIATEEEEEEEEEDSIKIPKIKNTMIERTTPLTHILNQIKTCKCGSSYEFSELEQEINCNICFKKLTIK